MILTPDEERALLSKAHSLLTKAKEMEHQANLVFEQLKQSQYERMNGIRQGEGDGG